MMAALCSVSTRRNGRRRYSGALPHKYGMRFYEFATPKPKKPKKPSKPLTPEQSVIAARKRDVDQAKQALDRTTDQQKRRREFEKAIKASYIFKLQNR